MCKKSRAIVYQTALFARGKAIHIGVYRKCSFKNEPSEGCLSENEVLTYVIYSSIIDEEAFAYVVFLQITDKISVS